jgi:glucose-6-phosphate dehydrogenase assembly protein OpcA
VAQPVAATTPAPTVPSGTAAGTNEVLAEWGGEGITVGEVTGALDSMRRRCGRAATRTSVLSLVVSSGPGPGADGLYRLCRAVHPGRTVLLFCEPGRRLRLDGRATLRHRRVDGREIWWEEIALTVRGRVCSHLDSLVEPLTLSELPVAVWYPAEVPSPRSRLVRAADLVILDTEAALAATGDGDLRGVSELARRHAVSDLTWLRLGAWRQLLAGLFEAPSARGFLGGVDLARVEGPAPARQLLAGWLADRLGLRPNRVEVVEARRASVQLTSRSEGRAARFRVTGDEDGHRVSSSGDWEGGSPTEAVVALPEDPVAASLRDALTTFEHDLIYEQAVAASLDLLA